MRELDKGESGVSRNDKVERGRVLKVFNQLKGCGTVIKV